MMPSRYLIGGLFLALAASTSSLSFSVPFLIIGIFAVIPWKL
jgi:hypothetical protein